MHETVGVTNQWKRNVRAEKRAAMPVAGIYIKRKRSERGAMTREGIG